MRYILKKSICVICRVASRFAAYSLLITAVLVLHLPLDANAQVPSLSAKTPQCPNVNGISSLLNRSEHRFIVMGEIHGTEQTPALFGNLVCSIAKSGPVTVILEFPVSQSDAINRFTSSQGSVADRETLLSSWIWDTSFADGRSSFAMLNLLDRLRLLRASGLPIEVYAGQPDIATLSESQHYYELAMADRWAQIAAIRPKSRVLILTGRSHAMQLVDDDTPFPGAASFLPPKSVVTLLPELEGGATWNLQNKAAGIHGLEGSPATWKGIRIDARSTAPLQGTYAIGEPARPSLPAKAK